MKKASLLVAFVCVLAFQSSSDAAVYYSTSFAPPPVFTNSIYYSSGPGFTISIGTPYYRYSSYGRYMPPPPRHYSSYRPIAHFGHRPAPPPKHHGGGGRPHNPPPPHRR